VDLRKEIQSWKQFEPSSLLAQEYAAALMRVTLRGFQGLLVEWVLEISGRGSGSFEEVQQQKCLNRG